MHRSSVRRTFALRSECGRRSSSSTPITRMPGAPFRIGTISASQYGASGSDRRRPPRHLLLRWWTTIALDPCACLREPRLGRGGLGGQCLSVAMYSLIWWSVMCRPGKASIPSCRDEPTACTNRTRRQTDPRTRDADGDEPPVGLRPPFSPPPSAQSHPDCRWSLTLIAAVHSASRSRLPRPSTAPPRKRPCGRI